MIENVPFIDFFTWLAAQPLPQAISGSWLFAFFESLHVVGLAILIGSIALLDLRLLGLALKVQPVTKIARDILPWSWAGFCIVLMTGVLIFMGAADSYVMNAAFQVKMALLALAGVNMAVFHLFAWRTVGAWDSGVATTPAAKIAGGLSLLFWVGVVAGGRLIAFF